ncbi:hypothetical protein HK105_200146 [Polyrhizophydium stewartii]|uniref:Ankyrin repeat protein n=1 Tax=Polyrhizophydium stewartii TaxID=2732419 RepID=A0ABR4NKM7_9FUNG
MDAAVHALPWHVLDRVMAYAGPLTAYLHGEIARPLTEAKAREVLADAAWLDRHDLVAELELAAGLAPVTWEALLVRSPAMLLAVFPGRDGAELPPTGLAPAAALDLHHARHGLVRRMRPGEAAAAHMLLDRLCTMLGVDPHGRDADVNGVPLASDLLDMAAGLGRAALVRSLLPAVPAGPSVDAAYFAARNGHGETLALVLAAAAAAGGSAAAAAAAHAAAAAAVVGGRAELLPLVTAAAPSAEPPTRHAVALALQHGRVAAVWALLAPPTAPAAHPPAAWTWDAFADLRNEAAKRGHLDLLEFAELNDIGRPLSQYSIDSAAGTSVAMAQWLHTHHPTSISPSAMDYAAGAGRLDVVQWLHAHNACVHANPDGTYTTATDVPGYSRTTNSREKPAACSVMAFTKAAQNGHYEVFVWLWRTFPSVRPTTRNMVWAAYAGQLQIITFFVTETAAAGAGVGGLVGRLVGAAAAGDASDDLGVLLRAAIVQGHEGLAEYLLATGRVGTHELANEIGQLLRAAGTGDHLGGDDAPLAGVRATIPRPAWADGAADARDLAAALANGCRTGSLTTVAFLVDQCRVPVSDAIAAVAVHRGDLPIIAFLRSRAPAISWSALRASAAARGQWDVAALLDSLDASDAVRRTMNRVRSRPSLARIAAATDAGARVASDMVEQFVIARGVVGIGVVLGIVTVLVAAAAQALLAG